MGRFDDGIDAMFTAASAARANAYAAYSGFRVGAAVRAEDGSLFAGCNVENASYPLGLCAEAAAIAAMVASGHTRIVEILVVGGKVGDGRLCTPCGACRQRIRELAMPSAPVHICGPEGLRRSMTLDALLPSAFGPDNLETTDKPMDDRT